MRTYGLIGKPLTHSFSAEFFNNKFSREGIDARYLNFELPGIGDLTEMIAEYPDLCGFNVTIPYKELVIPYLTEMSETAKCVGAINVVKVHRSGDGNFTLEGYNTDAPAFARSLAEILPKNSGELLGALVLGSGGASKAVCFALHMLGVQPKIVSRTKSGGNFLKYSDLTPEIIESNQIIVNTTPLGTFPNVDTCPDIPYLLLTSSHVCMDLTYNPAETLFMKKCAKQGATVKNGAEMLALQARLSWQIWNE